MDEWSVHFIIGKRIHVSSRLISPFNLNEYGQLLATNYFIQIHSFLFTFISFTNRSWKKTRKRRIMQWINIFTKKKTQIGGSLWIFSFCSVNTNTTKDHVLNNKCFVAPLFRIIWNTNLFNAREQETQHWLQKKTSHFSYSILFDSFSNACKHPLDEKEGEKKMKWNACINVSADAHKTQICV